MKAHSARPICLFLALSLLSTFSFAQDPPKKKINKRTPQVKQAAHQLVRIEVKLVETKHMHRKQDWLKWMFTRKITKYGNGYYIEPNRVITNNHVINATLPKDLRRLAGVDDEDPLTVVDIKVMFRKAEVVKLDTENDLAELRVSSKRSKSVLPEPNAQPAKGVVAYSVNKDDYEKKELVTGEVIGPYTLAVFKDGSYEPTDVNPTYRLPPNMVKANVLGARLKIARGWSGCWVFDTDGKFIGIVRALHEPSSLTLLIPAQTVTNFVHSNASTGALSSQ